MLPVKVFIADDSATARQLMVHLINHSADMVVVGQAHNGQQAVRLTHELHPDVILMDIVMPGMDGRAATAMTALGELILLSNRSKAVPVRIIFLNNQPRCGIELDCTLPKPDGEIVRWNSKTDNLARAADTLDMQEHGNQIEIRVCVWL